MDRLYTTMLPIFYNISFQWKFYFCTSFSRFSKYKNHKENYWDMD